MCHFFVIILSKFGRMGNAIFLYQGGEFLEILQIRHNAQRLGREIVQYTHDICVQSQNCVQKPFRSSGFPGAREARERSRPVRAAAHFPAPFSWCNRVALAIRRFRAGEFRRRCGGNGPHARRAQKGRDTYGLPVGH